MKANVVLFYNMTSMGKYRFSLNIANCSSSFIRESSSVFYYLARAVKSLEPDLGKAVVSDFVQTLSVVCLGMYAKTG